MQVILFKNVDKLGMQGDVVNVANGYYRNYLGPCGVAVEATKHNLKRLEAKRAKLQAESEKQVQEAQSFAERLVEAQLRQRREASRGSGGEAGRGGAAGREV